MRVVIKKVIVCAAPPTITFDSGCAVVVSHDRWFLDRVATNIPAFEGEGQLVRLRGRPQGAPGHRLRPASPDQVPELETIILFTGMGESINGEQWVLPIHRLLTLTYVSPWPQDFSLPSAAEWIAPRCHCPSRRCGHHSALHKYCEGPHQSG